MVAMIDIKHMFRNFDITALNEFVANTSLIFVLKVYGTILFAVKTFQYL